MIAFRARARRVLGGIAGAALVATVPIAASRAGATAVCTATSGVTVIVDFSHWGGPIERGCAPGHPATGLDALQGAGFTTVGTTKYGDAFVCRIDGRPTPGQDSCVSTPPGNAYWAYYHALATDAGWTYNTIGVTLTHPAVGSIEAWAFGAGAEPGVSPAGAFATTPTTAPHTAPPPPPPGGPPSAAIERGAGTPTPATIAPPNRTSSGAPVSGASASGATVATSGAGSTTPETSAATTPRAGAAHRTARTGAPATTTVPASDARVVDRAAAAVPHHTSSGSPLPAILTVAIVALGAGTALGIARRRRSAPSS